MSKFGKYVGAFARDIIAEVIGWFVCIGFLVGAYLVGRGLTHRYFGNVNPDMIGLLVALALVWIYEHRNFQHKYDRLREQLNSQRLAATRQRRGDGEAGGRGWDPGLGDC